MPGIVAELAKVKYLKEVDLVSTLASEKEFLRVKEFLSPIATDVKIIHNDGKRINEIYHTLARNKMDVGQPRGKDARSWLCVRLCARPRIVRILLHSMTAISSPTVVSCWRGFAIRWRILTWTTHSAKGTIAGLRTGCTAG